MENVRIIALGSFAERLSEVEPPLTVNVRKALISLLHAESKRVGESFREQKHAEFVEALARESHTSKLVEDNRAQLREAEQVVGVLPPGTSGMHWVISAVSIACFFICFGAEYVFNRAVVPWLVSVSPRSLLGMALSMAPATAPIVLDRVFVALFDVHDTWEALKSTVLSPAKRALRILVRVAFFVGVGALNVGFIWLLADSRGIASHLRNNFNETVITALQQATIDKALLLLSIAITVDGALFYLFALHEWHIGSTIHEAKRESAERSVVQAELDQAYMTAGKDRSRAQQVWESIDELEPSVSGAYFAENMVRLEQVGAKPGPVRSAKEVVTQRLYELVDRRAMGAEPVDDLSVLGASDKGSNGEVV